jgi:hypothetical protein
MAWHGIMFMFWMLKMRGRNVNLNPVVCSYVLLLHAYS